jgi:hypothetical protein
MSRKEKTINTEGDKNALQENFDYIFLKKGLKPRKAPSPIADVGKKTV